MGPIWSWKTPDPDPIDWNLSRELQSQKAVSAYLYSKQILPFGFGRQCMARAAIRWDGAVLWRIDQPRNGLIVDIVVSVLGGPWDAGL